MKCDYSSSRTPSAIPFIPIHLINLYRRHHIITSNGTNGAALHCLLARDKAKKRNEVAFDAEEGGDGWLLVQQCWAAPLRLSSANSSSVIAHGTAGTGKCYPEIL